MNLPNGTVTFLFTDIEGSTRLWDRYPEAMRIALARHDALMREAIEDNNGCVFKTIGDAFCAAFSTASDALAAALAAQLALHIEPWQEPLRISARMALHTGAAEIRGDDYFGPPLNRVARLLSAGHGGQTLLSMATQELTRDALPPRASLQDLGTHSLRDLTRPETVFQILHPALPSDFPPLKSLDNPALPNNLPRQLTSFIGREKEISQVIGLLKKARLLTLTGAGGSGKTRLALQVAAELMETYPDGIWLVELAALSASSLVPQTVAGVLGVKERTGQPLPDAVAEFLASKTMLLLLDNCEHLLDACAQLVAALLGASPDLCILATSREALGIAGEQAYRVPSLSLPDPGQPATVQSIGPYEAVQLFIARAMLVQPDFTVNNANAPALAQLCFRLDGIPLAIELAAARVRSLSVEDVNSKLDNRFRLLTGGSRTALPRQQTLRALIDWSYDLLNEKEKCLLTRLSVFSGGWTLPAAEQVGAGESGGSETLETWEVMDLLCSLVDKSLALAEARGDSIRYRLSETVRQYAQERLETNGNHQAVESGHRAWCLSLVQEMKGNLRGPKQGVLLNILEMEHPNLRSALTRSAANEQEKRKQLQLAAALQDFWYLRGHLTEGRQRLEKALSQSDAAATPERGLALRGAGRLARNQGELDAAHTLLKEAMNVYRELDDQGGIARLLMDLGSIAYELNDYSRAGALWAEGLVLHSRLQDRSSMAHANHVLGILALHEDNVAAARQFQTISLALYREIGDRIGIAEVLHSLGDIARREGDVATSRTFLEESLTIKRELGLRVKIAESLLALSRTFCDEGNPATAGDLLEESHQTFRQLGDRWGMAETLDLQGQMAAQEGDARQAIARYKESLLLRRDIGSPEGILDVLDAISALLNPLDGVRLLGTCECLRRELGLTKNEEEQQSSVTKQAQLRATLGEEIFTSAWTEGAAMTLQQGIAYALERA